MPTQSATTAAVVMTDVGLRCQQAIGRDQPYATAAYQPEAALAQDEDGGKGEIDAERRIEAELVLRIESADETERAVERIIGIIAEGHGKEQHETGADHGAAGQRTDIEHAHGDQRADDMRHILNGGAGGDRRRRRPEGRQACEDAEGKQPAIFAIIAEGAAIVDQHQRKPQRIIGEDGNLAETPRIGEDEEGQRDRRHPVGNVVIRMDEGRLRYPHPASISACKGRQWP